MVSEMWQKFSFGDLCELIYRYPSYYGIDYKENGIPEIRGELIKSNGNIDSSPSNLRYISEETSNKFPKTQLKQGDVVLSVRGTIGKAGVVPNELEGANMTANLLRLSPSREVIDTLYFKHLLLSTHFQRLLDTITTATTIKTFKVPDLKELPIILPNFAEQQKIAAILSSVDEAIEKTEQIIEQTEKVKKGLMQQLLTKGIGHTKFKKTLLGDLPESWEVSIIRSHLLESKSGASLKSNEFTKSGIKVLPKKAVNSNGIFNIADIDVAYTNEKIAEKYSNSFVNKSYLITVLRDLVPSGPNIGRIIKIVDEDSYLIAQGVYGFKIDNRLHSNFIIYLSNSKYFRDEMFKKKVGSTQVHMRAEEFFNTEIPLPPIQEQIKISSMLSSYDSIIGNERKKIENLTEVKQGLMQSLLTGKVRVPINEHEVV